MSHSKPARPSGNALLTTVRDSRFQSVLSTLQAREAEAHEVLTRSDAECHTVFFPVTAVLALVSVLDDGNRAAAALVGNEGMAPLAPFHEVRTSPEQVEVHVPGIVLQMPAPLFQQSVAAFPELRSAVHRFGQTLLSSVAFASACDRTHSVAERLARWMLATHDRAPDDEFMLTHERLADRLGVRRASVSVVAEALREKGAIHYTRGRVRVMDRKGLLEESCPCYLTMRRTSERLLGVTS